LVPLTLVVVFDLFHSLDNLLVRFEEPSSMVRWDAPLFTVAWDDPGIPDAQIWDAITKGNVKPPNSGTLAVSGHIPITCCKVYIS
jgi:hypothetical protein